MGAAKTSRRILFSGRVQGVGFRATTRSIARKFDVTGYVRNLSDGRVEVVAQGTDAEIERFIAAIEENMEGYVESVEQAEGPADVYFGFEVRYS